MHGERPAGERSGLEPTRALQGGCRSVCGSQYSRSEFQEGEERRLLEEIAAPARLLGDHSRLSGDRAGGADAR